MGAVLTIRNTKQGRKNLLDMMMSRLVERTTVFFKKPQMLEMGRYDRGARYEYEMVRHVTSIYYEQDGIEEGYMRLYYISTAFGKKELFEPERVEYSYCKDVPIAEVKSFEVWCTSVIDLEQKVRVLETEVERLSMPLLTDEVREALMCIKYDFTMPSELFAAIENEKMSKAFIDEVVRIYGDQSDAYEQAIAYFG